MAKNTILTADRLRTLLHYDLSTGLFTWLIETFELQPIGKSGFRGVTIKARLPKPFVAQIGVEGKRLHLGCFASGEEANAAYVDAAQRLLPQIKGTIAGSAATNGRWRIKIDYVEYAGHRLAWLYVTGEWPPIDIDHEDRDPLNNRWDNLRLATPSQNGANKMALPNSTGFKGVGHSQNNKRNPYTAMITVHQKKIYLGCFQTPEAAHAAYYKAAKEHFGEFARAA